MGRANVRFDEWLARRQRLHHDELKNGYLLFLEARSAELLAATAPAAALLSRLRDWERIGEGLRRLVEEAPAALSPAQLLDEPPLDRIRGKARELLERLLARAMERSPLLAYCKDLMKRLDKADAAYAGVRRALERGRLTRDLLVRYHRLCLAVSEGLSGLPHEPLASPRRWRPP